MRLRRRLTTAAAIVVGALSAPLASAVPLNLQVQGQVRAVDGPYDGTVSITVSLWDASEAGGLVHEETFDDTVLDQGVFSLRLGEVVGLPVAALTRGDSLWVEVEVDGAAVGARTALLPVASAFYAVRAGKAAALECDACLDSTHVGFNYAASGSKGGAAADADKLGGYTWTTVPEASDAWVNEGGDTMNGPLTVNGMVTAATVDAGALTADDATVSGTLTVQGASEVGAYAGFAPQAAEPPAAAGRMYYDANKAAMLVHNGTSWGAVGAGVPKGAIMFSETADDPAFIDAGYQGIDSALRLGEGWSPTKLTAAPTARYSNTCTWTGVYVTCFGGQSSSTAYVNTGGRYRPSTDKWATTSTTSAPGARGLHTAVWTGSQLLIWGGRYYSGATLYRKDGGRYDPTANTWATMAAPPAAIAARALHTTVWTGSKMIVWGGFSGGTNVYDDGARYDPATNTWATMFKGPSKRYYHSAVWTGSRMLIWGGFDGAAVLRDGGSYDPVNDVWTQLALPPVEVTGRRGHTAVWTGTHMIIFGGDNAASTWVADKVAAKYDPAANTWELIDTTTVADSRSYHSAVWTGTQMIVWGGMPGASTYTNTGELYDPGQDVWLPMNALNAPAARYVWPDSAVWTGLSLVVWGGYSGAALNTGGVYQPGLTLYPYRKL